MRNMLTGDNPARAGEDSYGKSEAIMIPPKGTGPLLKQRLWLYFCSRVIWNDNDQMYMYRQSRKISLVIENFKICSFPGETAKNWKLTVFHLFYLDS